MGGWCGSVVSRVIGLLLSTRSSLQTSNLETGIPKLIVQILRVEGVRCGLFLEKDIVEPRL
jgi:hypothetical protein